MFPRIGLLITLLFLIISVAGENDEKSTNEEDNVDKGSDNERNNNNSDKQESTNEEKHEEKNEESKQDWEDQSGHQYPPYEDLYCGHVNCYELLGVYRY